MNNIAYSTSWCKSRGLKGCVKDAWLVVSLNLKREFFMLWPVLALAAMSGARFNTLLRLPFVRLVQAGWKMDDVLQALAPEFWALVVLLLALALTVVSSYWALGRMYALLCGYAQAGRMNGGEGERRQWISRNDFGMARRLVSVDAAILLAMLVSSAVLALLAKLSPWCLLLSIPALGAFVVADEVARNEYAFKRRTYRCSLASAFGRGWGRAFGVDLVVMWPMWALRLVALLPFQIYMSASWLANDSLLMGDTVSMPGWLVPVFFILCAIGHFVVFFSLLWGMFARAMRLQSLGEPAANK